MKRQIIKVFKGICTTVGRLVHKEKEIQKSEDKFKRAKKDTHQEQEGIFRKELEYEESDVHADALEKTRRAIQMAHNNDIQGELMTVSFIDGYADQFIVVIGKEDDLLCDDTFKRSRIRERFYFSQKDETYMAIGISRENLPNADDTEVDHEILTQHSKRR